MNLSKSKYCIGITCPKQLWLKTYKPEEEESNNESIFETGHEVGELAKNLFGPYHNISFNEDLNKMIEDTKTAIKEGHNIITEASFIYENNFCSIDILKINNNQVELYEVKSSTEITDIYLQDISYQTYILLKLGYKINKCCIVYINNKYQRNGELELDKLFNIEDVTNIVHNNLENVQLNIDKLKLYINNQKEPNIELGPYCMKPYTCPFFKYCTKHLTSNNIFTIRGMSNNSKFKYYNKGIYTYEDLLKEDILPKYKQQIEYTLYNKSTYIDMPRIKEFLSTLSYPMYFLDFETYQQAIPQYNGITPYMQIPFQYSLHYIINKDDNLQHKEFLAQPNIDPRRALAEQLVKDIPINSCVIAYNMKFEKMVIKNLTTLYPDLTEHLMNIHDNMHDLMIPFKNRNYYTKEMQGSYSIKYVLPALFPNDPSLNYHNLELIHNGTEAMTSFSELANKTKEEQQLIRKCLLKYCELDTYAMVKIYNKLKEICK